MGTTELAVFGWLCFALISVPIFGVVIWLVVVVSKKLNPPYRYRWVELSRALGLRIERQLPDARLEGQIDGLDLAVEECLVSGASSADVALGVLAIAVGETPGGNALPVTFIRCQLHPALGRAISFVHTGSGKPLRSDAADRDVAGHENPLADTVHRVRSADVAWAVSWLGQLRDRGGVGDIETEGWRVSFSDSELLVEHDGRADESSVRGGIERARAVIQRLRGEDGHR